MSFDEQIHGVAHIGIRVHDLERSRRFYEQLGFKFVVGPVGLQQQGGHQERHPGSAEQGCSWTH